MQSRLHVLLILWLSIILDYSALFAAADFELASLYETGEYCGNRSKVQVEFDRLNLRHGESVDRSMEVLQFTLKYFNPVEGNTNLFERQTIDDQPKTTGSQVSFALCLRSTETFQLYLHSYIPESLSHQARQTGRRGPSVGGAVICGQHRVSVDEPFTLTPSILRSCSGNTKNVENPSNQVESYPIMRKNAGDRKLFSKSATAGLFAGDDPTVDPSMAPSFAPSSVHPTFTPTRKPTKPKPTRLPTSYPTSIPTSIPTSYPTAHPTPPPTSIPTSIPTSYPSPEPTSIPTARPTKGCNPSSKPTDQPSSQPSAQPSSPSSQPTSMPSRPTALPTPQPSAPSVEPTLQPSAAPSTTAPSTVPTLSPSGAPTATPTAPSAAPTQAPTSPTAEPSAGPTAPTVVPSVSPTMSPSPIITVSPTESPTAEPTVTPSLSPSTQPSSLVGSTVDPTTQPSHRPTDIPHSGNPQQASGSRTAFVQTDSGIGTLVAAGVVALAIIAFGVFYCVRMSQNLVKVPQAPANLAMQI